MRLPVEDDDVTGAHERWHDADVRRVARLRHANVGHAFVAREPRLELVDDAHAGCDLARAAAADAVPLEGADRGRADARVVAQAEVVIRRKVDDGPLNDARTCGIARDLPFGHHRPNCALRTVGTL